MKKRTKDFKKWKQKIPKYQQQFHYLYVCITVLSEFIWVLALLILQYGNFLYKCRINLSGASWRGAALLGGTLTSMRVLNIKGI